MCRKKCEDWEFYDPKNPFNCYLCWDSIPGCDVCVEQNEKVGA